jgi:hypothetical protein
MPRQLYEIVSEGRFNPITGNWDGRKVRKSKHPVATAVDIAIKELGNSNDFWIAIENLLKGSAKKAVADIVKRAEEILDGPVSDIFVRIQLFVNDGFVGRWEKAILEAQRFAVAKAHQIVGTQSSRYSLAKKAQEILTKEFQLDEEFFEITDEFCGVERIKIRRINGIKIDCRKYSGQPARDMVKKAA